MKLLKNPIMTIVLFILIFGLLPNSVVEAMGKVSKGSSIAGVNLEGATLEEAKQLLESRIEDWQGGEPILAVSEYETISIPRTMFQFDIDASLTKLNERMKRHWSTFFMKQKNVKLPLEVTTQSNVIDWPEYVDVEETVANANLIAGNLEETNVTIKYIDGATIEQAEIADISYRIPDVSDAAVKYLVEELDGLTVKAESSFSFLDTISLPNGMDNGEVEMSFVASGLYALALQTNIEIIERHQQEKVTSYAKAGMDVAVDRKAEKNLLLYNPNAYEYTVNASIEGEQMKMSIHSFLDNVTYSNTLENNVEVEPRTLYRYNPDLAFGEEEVVQQGVAGVQIEVYRVQNAEDGNVLERELVSRDFYFPTPEIIEVSTQEAIPEEELAPVTEDPVEETTPALPELNLGSLVDILPSTSTGPECEADPSQCDRLDEDPSEFLLACMLKHETGAATAETEEAVAEDETNNPYCDLMYLYLFLSLFGNESIQAQTEDTDIPLDNEEISAGSANDEEVR
ncbi:hypothetical protein CWR48_17015 [Oceanobacillus arenosus]|uniref:G5 domain-containing protein n=1 Tax=Oceanobacillus arenosus TaxID=1229153 RepID=A0A3D8PMH4_9BACI|nr:G5 domain-containing protein [Oceanobacillus arenosus]RDW16345.1 hypothetical protein CWR48_17015 [Oceanobacillus arenosus]